MMSCGSADHPSPASAVDQSARPVEDRPVAVRVDGEVFESRYLAPVGQPLRAGLIFGPDWYGVHDYPLHEARRFASLGFGVLVVDVYGAGIHPANDAEAGRLFTRIHADRPALRARVTAAYRKLLEVLPAKTKVSAFGFSAGGMTVLELARSGAELSGVVVLSGILDNPTPSDAARIHAPVLVLHGTADAFAPLDQVTAFSREMDASQRAYRIHLFGGATHAFTNPQFANVTEGPFRYSDADARRADAAALEFLTALHPRSSAARPNPA